MGKASIANIPTVAVFEPQGSQPQCTVQCGEAFDLPFAQAPWTIGQLFLNWLFLFLCRGA